MLHKLECLNARRIAMTTGPDKGPLDWYSINGQVIIVHLFAKGGWEVYAPLSPSLSIQDTLDALDRIANPISDTVRLNVREALEDRETARLKAIAAKPPNAAGAASGVIADPLWTAYDLEADPIAALMEKKGIDERQAIREYGANNTTNTGSDGLLPALS